MRHCVRTQQRNTRAKVRQLKEESARWTGNQLELEKPQALGASELEVGQCCRSVLSTSRRQPLFLVAICSAPPPRLRTPTGAESLQSTRHDLLVSAERSLGVGGVWRRLGYLPVVSTPMFT